MKAITALAFAAALSLATAPAFAQTAPAAAPAAPAATAPAAGQKAPPKKNQRTAKSLECSKQADTQNLHGKSRRTFMNKCKKA